MHEMTLFFHIICSSGQAHWTLGEYGTEALRRSLLLETRNLSAPEEIALCSLNVRSLTGLQNHGQVITPPKMEVSDVRLIHSVGAMP